MADHAQFKVPVSQKSMVCPTVSCVPKCAVRRLSVVVQVKVGSLLSHFIDEQESLTCGSRLKTRLDREDGMAPTKLLTFPSAYHLSGA